MVDEGRTKRWTKWDESCTRPPSWILEIDITTYFDSMVRGQLMEMIESELAMAVYSD